jgi:hypothetical protein
MACLRRRLPLPVALLVLGCGSSEKDTEPGTGDPGASSSGIEVSDEQAVFRTDEITVEAGAERFVCFAADVPEDLVIDGYRHEAQSQVHHVIFSRAMAPEPDGLAECDVLFRNSWEPLFPTGAGASEIEFPDGVGHKLTAGEQLVLQLHLLNAAAEAVTDRVEIVMHRSHAADPRPVGTYVFGTLNVMLPPAQQSQIRGVCELEEKVELIAAFPHMHLLGQSLRFETGPSEAALEQVFERNPYDFDDQALTPIELTLDVGDFARVTCDYDNPYQQPITFGESTTNEMCFFVGLATDREGVSSCMFGGGDVGDPVPVDPAAGACGEHTPSADGVGRACVTSDDCEPGDLCTTEYVDGPGICFRIGCSGDADCGGTGSGGGMITCCSPAQAGGAVNVCVPEACRMPSCVPLP